MQRPLLSEDVVEYALHGTLDLERVIEWLYSCFPFLSSHIWQRDAFELQVEQREGMTVLGGATRFGDHVEDEWFIVFLLVELSRTFPDAVVECWDSDGQFLLIEAAMHLPDWLDSDSSHNRVFIHDGLIHIIPRPDPDHPENTVPFRREHLTLPEAVQIIHQYGPRRLTVASDAIQHAIQERLKDYPAKALLENHHYCRALLHPVVARMLNSEPALVARAVEAFYYRDEDDDRALVRKARWTIDPSAQVVARRVRFTRCLFAQLLHQRFVPPSKLFATLPPNHDPRARAAELGMKLTCGFEILTSRNPSEWEPRLAILAQQPVLSGEWDAEKDDPDDWLFISHDELDALMEPHVREAAEVRAAMDTIDQMKQFLEHESSMDGAEIPGSMEEVFDVSKFMNALQRGLDLPEEDVDDAQVLQQQNMMDEELRELRDEDYEMDDEGQMDIDLTLVKSIMDSFEASNGSAGAMQNLLAQLEGASGP